MNAKFIARDSDGNEVQTAATSLEPRITMRSDLVQLQFVGFVHDGAIIEMTLDEFKALRRMMEVWP